VGGRAARMRGIQGVVRQGSPPVRLWDVEVELRSEAELLGADDLGRAHRGLWKWISPLDQVLAVVPLLQSGT